MNDYHTIIVFKQNLKDAEHRRQQAQYKQDALAANRREHRLNLSWLKRMIHQTHLPKIAVLRPLPARHPAIGD